jgi:hypothetical protein
MKINESAAESLLVAMAFNNAFLVDMIGLLISALLVRLCQKTLTKYAMAQ